MSRSYKKTPIYKAKSRFDHHQANKLVRRKNKVDVHDIREDYVQNGQAHRKLYPQWEVIDYVIYYPKSEWEKDKQRNPDYRMEEKDWKKTYRRK